MPAAASMRQFLQGRTIGLSISDSEDLESLGMHKAVLDLAYIEIARHLLAHGADLVYGGDLRQAGYTRQLFDLVRAYDIPGQDVSDRVTSYLAWPLHLTLSDAERIDLLDVATVEAVPIDPALADEFGIDAQTFLPPDTPTNRYVWSRCLTDMRRRMNDAVDARIVLGGQSDGFKGRYPGIAEEAMLAVQAGMPLYLLGGFGGCTGDLVAAIDGRQPRRLSRDFQLGSASHAAGYAEFYAWYNQRHADEPIDYDQLLALFRDGGVQALHNGLSPADNAVLFRTDDVDEMIALVLRGLSKLFAADGNG